MQAALALGTVRHTRLTPRRHGFSYPAYFLRLPLRSLARGRWPWRLLRHNAAAPFVLRDADHGDGGPMLGWIDSTLARAGIHDADGEIWLHTLPRQLGYVFNPVSFWLCERADGSLRAVVAEVNNTFGERHAYVLAHADARPIRWGETLVARKAMHVSPFARVQGGYRFRFLYAQRAGAARFVTRIDYDEGGAPTLATAIEGRLRPLTDRALCALLLARPLATAGVIARIHWQALRLWAKGVPFYRKADAERPLVQP